MKKEITIFFTALMFYTRIPCPASIDHHEEYLNRATKFFPLIGWIVGGISVLVMILALQVFSAIPAIVLALIASVLTTGAFHEDGFADVCDGFGGGWTKEKILDIMKDSRVGTFGASGIVLIYLLKVYLIHDLLLAVRFDYLFAVLLFTASHAVSRFIASTFILTHTYVRENDTGKSKPIAKSFKTSDFIVAGIFALIPLSAIVFYFESLYYLLILLPVYLCKVFLGRYFNKWIGGYTGDCLGATQQVTEIVFLASTIIVWKFT